MKENRKLLKEVLKDIRHDMTDEEVLNLLADSKISVNPDSGKEKYTLGQRAADAIAKFAGSWAFIFSFTGGLVLWMVVNSLMAARAFDPYPFILLNLVLSCIAAIQAPLIMMSQNRQEESVFQIFSALPLDKSVCRAYTSVSKVANKRTCIRANSIHRCDEKLPASMITVPQIG